MRKFECHITCNVEHAAKVQELGEFFGFKFSRIDGDVHMGAKPFCYLTAYEPDAANLYTRMQNLTNVLEAESVVVLRRKIEEIVFDTKTGVDILGFAA